MTSWFQWFACFHLTFLNQCALLDARCLDVNGCCNEMLQIQLDAKTMTHLNEMVNVRAQLNMNSLIYVHIQAEVQPLPKYQIA